MLLTRETGQVRKSASLDRTSPDFCRGGNKYDSKLTEWAVDLEGINQEAKAGKEKKDVQVVSNLNL